MVGMSEQVDNTTRRGLRWYSFSLRTLMIVVLLVGVVLAPVVWKWHRYQKQKAVVDWIHSSRGSDQESVSSDRNLVRADVNLVVVD